MKLKYSYVDGGFHPKLNRHTFHWKCEAFDGTEAPRYNRYICGVLGAVAQGTGECDELLRFIQRVECGEEKKIVAGGNDVTLTFNQSGVQVDIQVNDDWVGQLEGHFTLQEWRIALEAWKRFLQMPESLDSMVEITL